MPAHAQNSITLYGLLDVGLRYINHPTLPGLRGTEDRRGGSRAVFELTSQFSVDNGSVMPARSLF